MYSTAVKVVTHAPHLTKPKPGESPPTVVPKKRLTIQQPVWDKATALARALAQWGMAGLPLASETLKTQRLAICAACELWDPAGNWVLGQCKAPGCGCTKLKAWLLTEKCPHPSGSRWPVDPPEKGE